MVGGFSATAVGGHGTTPQRQLADMVLMFSCSPKVLQVRAQLSELEARLEAPLPPLEAKLGAKLEATGPRRKKDYLPPSSLPNNELISSPRSCRSARSCRSWRRSWRHRSYVVVVLTNVAISVVATELVQHRVVC